LPPGLLPNRMGGSRRKTTRGGDSVRARDRQAAEQCQKTRGVVAGNGSAAFRSTQNIGVAAACGSWRDMAMLPGAPGTGHFLDVGRPLHGRRTAATRRTVLPAQGKRQGICRERRRACATSGNHCAGLSVDVGQHRQAERRTRNSRRKSGMRLLQSTCARSREKWWVGLSKERVL